MCIRDSVSAQQLDSLVRDVLDLARSQTGQLRLIKAPLDPAQILRPVALIGEEMARAKGLEWEAIIPDDLPRVYGDASRLRQVVLNLVTNAVKFTTCGRVTLIAETDDDSITISVSDTGLGVPLAEQEAIFDEFRQSERTAARGYGGLGIGLAICRELVELHGGQIGVRSSGEEEGGSTFYFTLPALRDEVEPLERRPASQTVVLLTSGPGDDGRLLESLRRDGFQAASLYLDGDPNWLNALLALEPGAVLLDCGPASVRGWQVIETLRSHPALQAIPVLFYALPESAGGAMLALSHLTKPIATSALTQALERYGLTVAATDHSKTILVVDDDPDILEMQAQMVAAALPGCRVLRAANGRLALELMRSERPSLVLLDLMMPEMDGMAVLSAMQEDERLRGVPVIVVTAQALTQREMEQLNRGVAAVLQKGLFTPQETLAHIEAVLTRSKRLGSEAQRTTRKAMAYIHEHYAEPISREELAAHIGVSARHLTRCFHQEMGISPITYLGRYRVERAKRLLEAGDKTITEVAIATGFGSSSYFADAFRRETGMSPREYQRRALAPKSRIDVPNTEDTRRQFKPVSYTHL
ncbi:MAG: ATP-binding protein, partial [Anaerolineae bacterium]|nr:ATP-binding protein [Anaerolineae bacterium]